MNVKQIAARAAARKAAAVANLQDVKHQASQRADELYQARKEQKSIFVMQNKEREVMAGNPFDLFPTPADLAARMVAIADQPLYSGAVWIEPSAGTGRIAQAMREAGHEPAQCIELNYNAAALLQERGFNVLHCDFLDLPTPEQGAKEEDGRIILPMVADVFVMNPPFSNGQDVKHVSHAYNCLSPGGRIVAIMSTTAKARAFCEEMGLYPEELPAGTFKASGTMVPALLVVIDK